MSVVVRFVAIVLSCGLVAGCSTENSGPVQTSSSDDSLDEAEVPDGFTAEDAKQAYRVWFDAKYFYINEALRTGIPDPLNSHPVVDAMDPALLGLPVAELGSFYHDCSTPDWPGVYESGLTEIESDIEFDEVAQLREDVWLVATRTLTRMIFPEESTDWAEGGPETVLVTKDGVGPVVGNRFHSCEAWPRSERGHRLADEAADHLGIDRLRTCEEIVDGGLMPEPKESCFYESTPVVVASDIYSCSDPFDAFSYDIPAVDGVGFWLGVDDLGWLFVAQPGDEQAHPGYESCFPDDGERPLTLHGG